MDKANKCSISPPPDTNAAVASRGGHQGSVPITGSSPASNQAQDHGSEVIIMALDMNDAGALGCAYLPSDLQRLFLLAQFEGADLSTLDALLTCVNPTTILIPAKTPASIMHYLENNSGEFGENRRFTYSLHILASADWLYEISLERLSGLLVTTTTDNSAICTDIYHDIAGNRQGRGQPMTAAEKLHLGSLIGLDCRSSICCAGAILGDVLRRRHGDESECLIQALEMFTISDFMLVDTETLTSLQIVQPKRGATFLGAVSSSVGSNEKSNLSMLGLFQALAETAQGRVKLRHMLLSPVTSIDLINARQESIKLFLEDTELLRQVTRTLRGIPDPRKALLLLRKGVGFSAGRNITDRGVLWTLAQFALHSLHLKEALSHVARIRGCRMIETLVEGIPVDAMKEVGELIEGTIDFRQAKSGTRLAVRAGLNVELDEMKRKYAGMEELLVQISSDLSRQIPHWAREYVTSCIFWPQVGFLTIVPLNSETGQPLYKGEGLQGDQWSIMFSANQRAYFKNARMRELDLHLGDIYGGVLDLELEIIHRLAIQVLRCEAFFYHASDACAEIDCLVALSRAAEKYNLVAPRLTTSNVLHIRGGRHLLQELLVPVYVPSACDVVGGSGDGGCLDGTYYQAENVEATPRSAGIFVLTGPNHSGKSVYIKQAALITYLAHVGSYVPASEAIVGLTDRILTRISTRETVTENESAFAIDLRQAALCLKSARRRSLVLIDEFGKGTRAGDGAGLMAALLHHFLSLGEETPRLLAATHFHEIFDDGHINSSNAISFGRMDAFVGEDPDLLTYLYKVVPGRSVSSFARNCGVHHGVEDSVTRRAEAIASVLSRDGDLRLSCARLNSDDEGQLDEAELVARRLINTKPNLLHALVGADVGQIRSILDNIMQGRS